jgi:hypothetical protein
MFVQVIHGRVNDADALRRQVERWDRELKPDAQGFLGSTIGVASDGEAYVVARFGSEVAARRNSERAEQDAWWKETEEVFEGPVEFHDSTEVELIREGGSDEAGFVQVLHGRARDPDRVRELDAQEEEWIGRYRPDVIGGLTAWHDGGLFTQVVYFTSEQEARAGERRMNTDVPDEVRERLEEWRSLIEGLRYTDLHDPWTFSP